MDRVVAMEAEAQGRPEEEIRCALRQGCVPAQLGRCRGCRQHGALPRLARRREDLGPDALHRRTYGDARAMIRTLLALGLAGLLAACGAIAPGYRDRSVIIASSANFDPARYLGRWHEVARYPNPFQARCAGAVVDYAQGEGGEILVRNTCLDASGKRHRRDRRHRAGGRARAAVGAARRRSRRRALLGALGRRGLSHRGRGPARRARGLDPEPRPGNPAGPPDRRARGFWISTATIFARLERSTSP